MRFQEQYLITLLRNGITQKSYKDSEAKQMYYVSRIFNGKIFRNNMINLTLFDQVKEVLQEMNVDINLLEDSEMDAGLGKWWIRKTSSMFPRFIGNIRITRTWIWIKI